MLPSDKDFICSSWIKSYFTGNEALRQYSPFDYYVKIQQKIIDYVIGHFEVEVVCAEDDPTHIYAYAAFSPGPHTVIHYMYVKHAYRKLGIGKMLMDKILMDHDHSRHPICSHVNDIWQKLYRYKYDLIHEPFNLEELCNEDSKREAS